MRKVRTHTKDLSDKVRYIDGMETIMKCHESVPPPVTACSLLQSSEASNDQPTAGGEGSAGGRFAGQEKQPVLDCWTVLQKNLNFANNILP